ncbi:6308_t:CDS:2 [Ambispora gerdemannii]|uniref:6308_t:CDS:1 n=1 Tax=Ambispora gerdemannii TaxID=144530 RepID=A0A9N8YM08_9GLOM|nr:6308_t:CDS:2 [Ambispora gerdemannii]
MWTVLIGKSRHESSQNIITANPFSIPELVEKVFIRLGDNKVCSLWEKEAIWILLNWEEEFCYEEIRLRRSVSDTIRKNLDIVLSDNFAFDFGEDAI